MGTSQSKRPMSPPSDMNDTFRRPIGKRSSVSFFQRPDSRPMASDRPLTLVAPKMDPPIEDLPPLPRAPSAEPVPQPLSSHPVNGPPTLSPSSTTTAFLAPQATDEVSDTGPAEAELPPSTQPQNIISEDLENANVADGESHKSSEPEVDETPSLLGPGSDRSAEETGESASDEDPVTPLAQPMLDPVSPLLRALTPLAEDSPGNAFDQAMETARVEATREMLKKRATTGPELFYHALRLQKSTNFRNAPRHDLAVPKALSKANAIPPIICRVYRPPRSRTHPSEIFRRAQLKHHSLPPKASDSNPRMIRLLRRTWPANLTRDNPLHGSHIRPALAMPLMPQQKLCQGRHARWHQSGNALNPVECGICLCASDCSTDTDASYTCDSCYLRICSECKSTLDQRGTRALMHRYSDGAETTEAKKARGINRRSAM